MDLPRAVYSIFCDHYAGAIGNWRSEEGHIQKCSPDDAVTHDGRDEKMQYGQSQEANANSLLPPEKAQQLPLKRYSFAYAKNSLTLLTKIQQAKQIKVPSRVLCDESVPAPHFRAG